MIVLLMYNSFISMNQRSVPAYLQRVFEFELSLILLICTKTSPFQLSSCIKLFHIDYSQGFRQGLYYHFKGLLELSEL